MSFCLRPNVCKKCGKPLTLFEGWYCLECDKQPTVCDIEQIRAEIDQQEKCDDCTHSGIALDEMTYCHDCLKGIENHYEKGGK